MLLFLLKRDNLPSKFIILFSLLVAAIFLTHVAEAVFFVIFISLWGVISKKKAATLDLALNGSFIGFLLVIIAYVGFGQIAITFLLSPEIVIAIALPLVLLAFSMTLRRSIGWWSLITYMRSKINKLHLKSSAVVISIFLYCLALLTIPFAIPSFSTSQILNTLSVPWFFYPLILGVTGFLCLFATIFIFRDHKLSSGLSLILAFGLFAFVTGRAISFFNVNFFFTNFFESRFIPYILITTSFIAPVAVLKLKSRLDYSAHRYDQKVLISVFLVRFAGRGWSFNNISKYRIL